MSTHCEHYHFVLRTKTANCMLRVTDLLGHVNVPVLDAIMCCSYSEAVSCNIDGQGFLNTFCFLNCKSSYLGNAGS